MVEKTKNKDIIGLWEIEQGSNYRKHPQSSKGNV